VAMLGAHGLEHAALNRRATGLRRNVVRGAADDDEGRMSWALALSTHVEAAGCLCVPADAVLAVVG
jgi:hypothetical protein